MHVTRYKGPNFNPEKHFQTIGVVYLGKEVVVSIFEHNHCHQQKKKTTLIRSLKVSPVSCCPRRLGQIESILFNVERREP